MRKGSEKKGLQKARHQLYDICKTSGLDDPNEFFAEYADFKVSASLDENGSTALFIACKRQHFRLVKALLAQEDVDPNRLTQRGGTLILMACHQANELIMNALLDAGADINLASQLGRTALFCAYSKGDLADRSRFVELLLRQGACKVQALRCLQKAPYHQFTVHRILGMPEKPPVHCRQYALGVLRMFLLDEDYTYLFGKFNTFEIGIAEPIAWLYTSANLGESDGRLEKRIITMLLTKYGYSIGMFLDSFQLSGVFNSPYDAHRGKAIIREIICEHLDIVKAGYARRQRLFPLWLNNLVNNINSCDRQYARVFLKISQKEYVPHGGLFQGLVHFFECNPGLLKFVSIKMLLLFNANTTLAFSAGNKEPKHSKRRFILFKDNPDPGADKKRIRGRGVGHREGAELSIEHKCTQSTAVDAHQSGSFST